MHDKLPALRRFSNTVLQALLVLLKKRPPKGHKLLIIGTTSNQSVLNMMGIVDAFSRVMHVDNMTEGSEVRDLAFLLSRETCFLNSSVSCVRVCTCRSWPCWKMYRPFRTMT